MLDLVQINKAIYAMYVTALSDEGACYSYVTGDAGISAAALGAIESAAALGASESSVASASESAASAEALHTFTLDSGASCCFFRDCTTLTPLAAPVPVSLADPTRGPVVARASTILPCPAVPSGSLSGLHLPTFSTNLVSNAALQDVWTLLWHHCLGHPSLPHLHSMHSRLLVSGLPRSLPSLPRSPALPCLPCVEGWQRAAPHSSEFPPTTAPLQTLHMDADVSGVLIPCILATRRQLRERFRRDLPILRMHSDRGDEFSSDLLAELCEDKGIRQSFTLPTSPQQNGIAKRRIGLIMEVARTSMIHVAAPHFLWPFAVRYATHQLNLWPRGPAPSGVSQVDSPPLVEPLEISSDSSGPAEGGDPTADDTAATRRSPRLETPPVFPPRLSSPPPQPAVVDSEAETAGAEPRGAEAEGEGSGGAATGGAGSGGAEPGGADSGGAASPGGGGGSSPAGAGATSPGGVGGTARGTRGVFGVGGTRGATGTGVPGGTTGAGGSRGTPGDGGTGAVGAVGAGGAGGAGGARATTAGGTGGPASTGGNGPAGALSHLLALPPAPTEFPVAGTTPPLLFPQLLPHSPLLNPAPYTAVTESLTERREPETRASTPERREPETRASVRARVPRVRRSRAPAVLDTHDMTLRPSSVPLRVVLPSPPESSLPAGADPLSDCYSFSCYDALDIPTPRSYREAISGEYSSQWQIAMDAEMASWKSTGTYVDEVPPFGANIVSGMWIFRVKRLPGSPPAFKAPREWHDTLRTTLAALGFAPSTTDPSLFLRTDTSLPPFYVLVCVDDLVFAIADMEVLQRFGFQFSSPQPTPLSTSHLLSPPPSDESVEPSGSYPELVGCLMYLMTCTRPDLAYPLSLLVRYVAPSQHRKVHWDAAKRVLRYLCSTSGMGLVLGGRGSVVLIGHSEASWADDQATQRSSWGYTFSLVSGSVSWRSTRSSSVLGSSYEVEIYAGAMAAQELRWLTYLLTDLGERPRSSPVL
ncbi:unnamed protein product [Closterium sp. NIES-53]